MRWIMDHLEEGILARGAAAPAAKRSGFVACAGRAMGYDRHRARSHGHRPGTTSNISKDGAGRNRRPKRKTDTGMRGPAADTAAKETREFPRAWRRIAQAPFSRRACPASKLTG